MEEKEIRRLLLEEYQDPTNRNSSTHYFLKGSPTPSRRLQEAINKSNASNMAFRPTVDAPPIRYLNDNLNVGGVTRGRGPLKGLAFVSGPEDTPENIRDKINSAAHEAYHSRVVTSPEYSRYYPLNKQQEAADQRIAKLMTKYQPPEETGEYWGVLSRNPNRNERIASIQGYEGALPKGTSLLNTPFGKEMDQEMKNRYFSQSSHPYGGVWEGQVNPEDVKPQATEDDLPDYRKSLAQIYAKKAIELLKSLFNK